MSIRYQTAIVGAAETTQIGRIPDMSSMMLAADAAMNAIEYGSQGKPEIPVAIAVETSAEAIVVRITDQGLSGPLPSDAEAPDIDAKLAGLQKPRGWGLFLIRAMVDEMDVTTDGTTQTVSLTLVREERA